MNDMQSEQDSVEEPSVAQNEEPGVGAHQKTCPERQQHKLQVQVLPPARASDKERERKAEQRTQRRSRGCDPDRAPQNGEIERIEETTIVLKCPRLLCAPIVAASEKAVTADDGKRSGQKDCGHYPGGQQRG